MRIIVTGATGFVGTEIVGKLTAKNHDVYQIGFSKVEPQTSGGNVFKVDITDLNSVLELKRLKEIDVIIHSAGLAHQFGKIEKEKFWKTNIDGTKNILELAVILRVKHFILISSTAIYGTQKKKGTAVGVMDENALCIPQTIYAESKLEAERQAREICERNNIDLTIFRLAPVIGEKNAGNVQRMIEAIDKGRFIWIGKGENYKSLIDKADVAGACEKVIRNKKNGTEIFNLAAEPILMHDFVREAARNLERRIPNFSISPMLLDRIFRLNDNVFKIDKITKIAVTIEKWLSDDIYPASKFELEYDFKAKISIPEALKRQISWYREQADIKGRR